MEFTLLWAVLSAVAMGWLGLRLWGGPLPESASDRLIAATFSGLVVGRLTAMIIQGVSPIAHPADIIIVRGGVHTGAAALAFLATLLWTTRRDAGVVDAMAPAILLGLAGWHAGCLWRGACLGTASELPWAWAQAGSATTRHPVELYAAAGLVVAAYIVSTLPELRWLKSGSALALAAGIRLATEPMRPSLFGGPVVWYWVAIAVGVITVAWSAWYSRVRSPTPT